MRADLPRTPLLAGAALAILAVVQIVAPSGTPLPDEPMTLPRRARPIVVEPILLTPALARSPMFSPGRGGGGGGEGQGDGLALTGVAMARGFAAAVIRRGDGSVVTVRQGQMVEGWRVAAVSMTAAVLTRAGERRLLRLTANPPQGATPDRAAQGPRMNSTDEDGNQE